MLTLLNYALVGAENNYVPVFAGVNINAWGFKTLFSQVKCLMKLTDQGAEIECCV